MTVTKRWGLRLSLALACCVALWAVGPASAGKPGGTVTHTSTIYYSQHTPTINYQMYEDGANKTQVALPPGVVAIPSSKAYAGSRWWLTIDIDLSTGFPELFAYREDGNPPVQLTSAGPDVFIGSDPRWSNDGQDRFVTFNADNANGGQLCRLWITDLDIAAIQLGAPRFTGADIEFVLPHPLGFVDYCWANDDSRLAYLKSNYDNNGNITGRTIWVRILTDSGALDLPIHTPANGEGAIKVTGSGNYFQWSPDGSRIAFSTYNSSSYGGVWTVQPDGTQAVKVKANSGTMSYTSRGWSPDGQELLLHTIKDRGFGVWYYNLARMPAGGGTLTTLTGDLLQSKDKTAVGWVPLSP